MTDIYCPYCESPQDIDHDDGYGYEENIVYQQECSNCGKNFAYTTTIMFHYHTHKADCLNGGDHEWKQTIGVPRAFFVGKYVCRLCDEERIFDPEAHKKAMDEYFKELEG